MVTRLRATFCGVLVMLLGVALSSCRARQDSPEDVVAWLNQEVSSEVIQDFRVDFRLDYRGLDRNAAIGTQFHLVVRGASREASQVVVYGITAYLQRANQLLATKQLAIEGGFVSDYPFLNQELGIVTWEQPLWIIPARKH
jgi:hypothetical protein